MHIVGVGTLVGFAELGWSVQVHVDDVLGWADRPQADALATPAPRWDLITTTLFLHHFDAGDLDRVLCAAATNSVTCEGAVLIVRAGFRSGEISALWPSSGQGWQTSDGAAGLFSHCLSAPRCGAASNHKLPADRPSMESPLACLLSLLAMQHEVVLPAMHLQQPDPDGDLDDVANLAREGVAAQVTVSNAFAFGGTNAVLGAAAIHGLTASASLHTRAWLTLVRPFP